MKKLSSLSILLIFASFLFSTTVSAEKKSSEQKFKSLDAAIEQQQEFLESKEARIAELQKKVSDAKEDKALYDALFALYGELSTFNSEKALAALVECQKLAEKMGNADLAKRAKVYAAYQKSLEGRYEEALKMLGEAGKEETSKSVTESYLFVQDFIYDKMALAEKDKDKAQLYRAKALEGAERYFETADKKSPFYFQHQVMRLLSEDKLTEASNICDQWESRVKRGTSDYALMARYMAVSNKKDSQRQLPWLITAARSEVESAMMNGDALLALSAMLEKKGDTERSTRYSEYAKQMRANFLARAESATPKKQEVVPNNPAPVVKKETKVDAKEIKGPETSFQLPNASLIIVLALLSVLILLCLFVIVRLRRKLAFVESKLLDVTDTMAALRMGKVALTISEKKKMLEKKSPTAEPTPAPQPANPTAEGAQPAKSPSAATQASQAAPVGSVPPALAPAAPKPVEVAKPEPEKIIVKVVDETKVKKLEKEIERLKKRTANIDAAIDDANRTKEMVPLMVGFCARFLNEEQMEDVYARFDAFVLKLFPRFATDFNALLEEEHRQIPRSSRALTTEMRMAALIRMGITNSAQIADFLHLSANTVYNYRARLKSKAIGDRLDFEERIMEIK